jgi:hypothetical protein
MRASGKRLVMCTTLVVLVAVVGAGFVACAGSPTAPTGPSTPAATIDSVVTTFRGAVVDSSPIVIDSPYALDVAVNVTLRLPGDSRVTMYLCVMDTASSVGVGTCVAMTSTVAEVQARANLLGMGISTFKTDGLPRTTHYLYVGLTEGTIPWNFTANPPQVGDTFGNSRVLATFLAPRTVTFR